MVFCTYQKTHQTDFVRTGLVRFVLSKSKIYAKREKKRCASFEKMEKQNSVERAPKSDNPSKLSPRAEPGLA
jgi:hypothetical protein